MPSSGGRRGGQSRRGGRDTDGCAISRSERARRHPLWLEGGNAPGECCRRREKIGRRRSSERFGTQSRRWLGTRGARNRGLGFGFRSTSSSKVPGQNRFVKRGKGATGEKISLKKWALKRAQPRNEFRFKPKIIFGGSYNLSLRGSLHVFAQCVLSAPARLRASRRPSSAHHEAAPRPVSESPPLSSEAQDTASAPPASCGQL